MEQFSFNFQRSLKSELPQPAQDLITTAELAAGKAYAPYSKFKVGAALLHADGTVLTGANQENASSPAGICAERALLAAHDMEGSIVKAIAIAYKTARQSHHPPLSPCGLCRQSIFEVQHHQQSPIALYMSSPDGEVIFVEDIGYLLPFHFNREYL